MRDRSAGRPLAGDRGTARHDDTSGFCIQCGIRATAIRCPKCEAWHRWYIAYRTASGYLRRTR